MPKLCPVNHAHKTKTVPLATASGGGFDFCEVCQEDVEYLSRKLANFESDETPAHMADAGPGDDEEDENWDDDNEDWEDDDSSDPWQDDGDDEEYRMDPFQNPPGFNHNPQLDLGNGAMQVVLYNDAMTGQMVVEDILREAFGHDRTSANYLMMEAHYKGQSVCKHINAEAWPEIQKTISAVKEKYRQMGLPEVHLSGLRIEMIQR